LVDSELKPLPIVERVINEYYTQLASFLYLPNSAFRKEFPSQIVELKVRKPFKSPELLEETMQKAILSFLDFLKKKYDAQLLGTGMHPLLGLEETSAREYDIIAQELGKVFPLKRHGWLNIQSFQINLPYSSEQETVTLHTMLVQLCTYLPAISAASPICKGQMTPYDDFRLVSYKSKSVEFPSVTSDVIPEYISSFSQYEKDVSDVYSRDLTNAGVLVGDFGEYINQRGIAFKFKRNALEVRVIDEQECIRSDVALSCLVRSTIRGLTASDNEVLPHRVLVNDYNSIVRDGLEAETLNPLGKDAKHVRQYFLNLGYKYADMNEKRYLWIIQKRIKGWKLI
jgi:carboxylate-amine ligase